MIKCRNGTILATIPGGNWIKEATPPNITAIASSPTGIQVLLDGDGAIFARRGIGNTWVKETDPKTDKATAIAVGGDTQMFLRGDGAVFAQSGIGGTWRKETEPKTAIAVAVSSTGVQMIITRQAAIWAKKDIGYGGWTEEVDQGNADAIAVGGDTQMFVRSDNIVYAKVGIGEGGWKQQTDSSLVRTRIAASSTGVLMYIRGGAAFARIGIDETEINYDSWTQETNSHDAWAIAVGGDTQMFIGKDGGVFVTNSIGRKWTPGPGNAQFIAAG